MVLWRFGAADGCNRAVPLSREEASEYSRRRVDIEHLLLGPLGERKKRRNLVAWCLADLEVTLEGVRGQVENTWSPDREAAGEGEFAFKPRSRNAVEGALRGGPLGGSLRSVAFVFADGERP